MLRGVGTKMNPFVRPLVISDFQPRKLVIGLTFICTLQLSNMIGLLDILQVWFSTRMTHFYDPLSRYLASYELNFDGTRDYYYSSLWWNVLRTGSFILQMALFYFYRKLHSIRKWNWFPNLCPSVCERASSLREIWLPRCQSSNPGLIRRRQLDSTSIPHASA